MVDKQKQEAILRAIEQARVSAARKEQLLLGKVVTSPGLKKRAAEAVKESAAVERAFERQVRVEQKQPVETVGRIIKTPRARPQVIRDRALPVSVAVSPRKRFQEERTAGLKKFRESAAVKKPFSRALTKASVKLLELGRPTREPSKSIKQLFVEGISPIARRKQQLKEVKELVKAPISLVGGLGLVVAQPRETLGPFVQTAPKISSPGKKFFVRTAGTAGAIGISTARGIKQEFRLGSREAVAAQILTAVALPKAISKFSKPKFKVETASGIKFTEQKIITPSVKSLTRTVQKITPKKTIVSVKPKPQRVVIGKRVLTEIKTPREQLGRFDIEAGPATIKLGKKGITISAQPSKSVGVTVKAFKTPGKPGVPRFLKRKEVVITAVEDKVRAFSVIKGGTSQTKAITLTTPKVRGVTQFRPQKITPSRAVGVKLADLRLEPRVPLKQVPIITSVTELETTSPFFTGVAAAVGITKQPVTKITQTQPVISFQKQPQVQRLTKAIQPTRIVSAKARVIIQKPVPITITAPILKTKQVVRPAVAQQRITRQRAVMPKVSAPRIPVARLSFPISKTPLKVRTSPLGRGFKVSFLRRGKLELSRFAAFETKGEARRFGAIASLRTKSIKGFTIRQTQFAGTERLFKNLPRFSVLSPSFVRSGSLFVEKPRKRKKKKKGGKR